ncbi:MAG: hypothetical protein MI861_18035, partial [Pirellulales bacterium]|nr:hypothetical protein [Pirellulales bacterium]
FLLREIGIDLGGYLTAVLTEFLGIRGISPIGQFRSLATVLTTFEFWVELFDVWENGPSSHADVDGSPVCH